jgi:glycosyltransferase involved in cell wall biosynthesis
LSTRNINVHVYPSTFEFETRILKVTATLVARELVDEVLVVAKAGAGLPKEAWIDERRRVVRVGAWLQGEEFWAKALRFIEWSVRVLWRLRRERVSMVNCHSLSVLPLCVAIKWLHCAILVYEPHELESETATFTGWRRRLVKWVEHILIGQASRVIVVSDSISRHYQQDYGLAEVSVIMNVPESMQGMGHGGNDVLRSHFGIPDGHLVFMYQGALEEERGVLLLMRAFQQVPVDRHLVFMGFGSLTAAIKSAAETYPNLHLYPAVPPDKVIHYTRGADIGFALLYEDCENHRCALPNKLFHYLHAGLPVIVSDLPEMGALVDRYACGWRVRNTEVNIAERVAAVNASDRVAAAHGAICARAELHWDNEADKLEAIYRDLLAEPVT